MERRPAREEAVPVLRRQGLSDRQRRKARLDPDLAENGGPGSSSSGNSGNTGGPGGSSQNTAPTVSPGPGGGETSIVPTAGTGVVAGPGQ